MIERIQERFADNITEAEVVNDELRLEATPAGLLELCCFLRDDESCAFDFPADLTAYETPESLILWLRLYSTGLNRSVIVTVPLSKDQPAVPSLTSIWPGTNWHEREVFDLYGIRFIGHPDGDDPEKLRILLPEDWIGHPFRGDYEPVFTGDPLHGPQETN